VIADVDSYHSFLPFATTSKVLSAALRDRSPAGPLVTKLTGEKGWLKDQMECESEQWDLEAELKIGAMGYEEGYVSRVELKKWSSVTVSSNFRDTFY
jgi:coenzyme Q-binding protein COQ10